MSAWIVAPCAGLIEPSVAPEYYVESIGGIEFLNGGTVRLHLVCEQMPLEAAGAGPQNVVVLKIVGPISSIPAAIGQLAQCLWQPIADVFMPPKREKPTLVP